MRLPPRVCSHIFMRSSAGRTRSGEVVWFVSKLVDVSFGDVMEMNEIRLTLRLERWIDGAMGLVGGEMCRGICMLDP
jgi:hypothetical protein